MPPALKACATPSPSPRCTSTGQRLAPEPQPGRVAAVVRRWKREGACQHLRSGSAGTAVTERCPAGEQLPGGVARERNRCGQRCHQMPESMWHRGRKQGQQDWNSTQLAISKHSGRDGRAISRDPAAPAATTAAAVAAAAKSASPGHWENRARRAAWRGASEGNKGVQRAMSRGQGRRQA